MSLLKRLVMTLNPAGFDGMLDCRAPDANIHSAYNLCVQAIEEMPAIAPASTYTLCIRQERALIPSTTSVYNLSTAPT